MDNEEIVTNLINIRTQLTVATLAAARLRRTARPTEPPPEAHAAESARLFSYLDRALSQVERETKQIEASLSQRERRHVERVRPLRLLLGVVAAGAMAAARVRRGQRQMVPTIL